MKTVRLYAGNGLRRIYWILKAESREAEIYNQYTSVNAYRTLSIAS